MPNIRKALPKYVSNTYRFLKKNRYLQTRINYLSDTAHQLFETALNQLLREAQRINNESVIEYFSLILEYYHANSLDVVYSFVKPLKDFEGK